MFESLPEARNSSLNPSCTAELFWNFLDGKYVGTSDRLLKLSMIPTACTA